MTAEVKSKKEAGRGKDPINPYSPKAPAHIAFQLLVTGGTKDDIIDELETRLLEADSVEEDASIVFNALMNRMGTKELMNFEVRKNGKGLLELYRCEKKQKEERVMTLKTAKKKVLAASVKKKDPTKNSTAKKTVKPAEKVKVAISRNGLSPFQAGSGISIAFEELEKGGTLKEIVKRTTAEFKKQKPSSGDPEGRVRRVVDGIKGGWHEKLVGLKIKETKSGVLQVVKK